MIIGRIAGRTPCDMLGFLRKRIAVLESWKRICVADDLSTAI